MSGASGLLGLSSLGLGAWGFWDFGIGGLGSRVECSSRLEGWWFRVEGCWEFRV